MTSTSSLVSIADDDEIADGEIVDEEDRLQRIIQGVVGVGMRGCNRAAPNSAGWHRYRSGIVQTVREREDEIAALVADCSDAPDDVLVDLAAHLIWPDKNRSLAIKLQRLKYSRSSLGLALTATR